MQGIVFDIKRFSVHDGPGIRTTVFFKGCPLQCRWCHNPEGIGGQLLNSAKKVVVDGYSFDHEQEVGRHFTVEQLMKEIRKDKIFMEESDGGVTLSGGEPTLQPEFLFELLQACKSEGIHTAVDTSGFAPLAVMEKIAPLTDLFLFDLKHINPIKHLEATGGSNGIILENLKYLLANRKSVRIRIPVIPGFNFLKEEMLAMASFLSSLPGTIEQVDLLPYHTSAQRKYSRFNIENKMLGFPELRKENLSVMIPIFESKGFRVKTGG